MCTEVRDYGLFKDPLFSMLPMSWKRNKIPDLDIRNSLERKNHGQTTNYFSSGGDAADSHP